MLPKALEDIIYKKKVSICVNEINEQIKQLDRHCFIADDVFPVIERFFPEHQVYAITTNKKFNIKPIHLAPESYRFIGCQWTYICDKCGEYLKICKNKTYKCKCQEYHYMY